MKHRALQALMLVRIAQVSRLPRDHVFVRPLREITGRLHCTKGRNTRGVVRPARKRLEALQASSP